METLCANAQVNKQEVADGLVFDIDTSSYIGFDFGRNTHVDMVTSGIIDPAKVTRCALENAVSVAGTLLTTSSAIVEE